MSDEADRLRDQLVAEIELRKTFQLKAERFEQALCKEVMEVVRKAASDQASQDSYTNACTSTQMRHLHEEIFRKDKEVERLKEIIERFQSYVERLDGKLMNSEKERLRLKSLVPPIDDRLDEIRRAGRITELKADVERLIFAGDNMKRCFKVQRGMAYAGQEYAEETQSMQSWEAAKVQCRHE